MRDDFDGEDFLSKIPPCVLVDFVRQRPSAFGSFLNGRNSVDTPDMKWIAETMSYQKHSSLWLEGKIDCVRKGVLPFKTLRDYRTRNMPLAIAVVPSSPLVRSLPYGSNVFVRQVLCQSSRVFLSKNHDGEHPSLTIDQAWDIVAGKICIRGHFTDIIDGFNRWTETSFDPHTFQGALLRVLEDPDTRTLLPIVKSSETTFYLPLTRSACQEEYPRSIEFHFSSDCVQQYDALLEACKFPTGVNTCIARYL